MLLMEKHSAVRAILAAPTLRALFGSDFHWLW